MAGTVEREWTWNVSVDKSGAPEQGAKVVAWDSDSTTPVVNQTTDSSGIIAQQVLQEKIISANATTPLLTEDAKTPHVISIVKYGNIPVPVNINFDAARNDTFFVVTDPNITETTKATVAAYAEFNINHTTDTITINDDSTTARLYDYTQNEAFDDPQKDYPGSIMTTPDGTNFTVEYDIIVSFTSPGSQLDGQGASYTISSPNTLTLNGGATVTDLTVVGDINVNAVIDLTDVNATTIDFSVAGTYSLTNCDATVTNSSGGNVIINSNNSTLVNGGPNITINNAVTVQAQAIDNTGAPIEGARLLLEAAQGGSLAYQQTVTITRSGSTATVTYPSPGHGLVTGDQAVIRRSAEAEYRGIYTVTVLNATQFTYTVSGTPATPATAAPGTNGPTAAAVILDGVSDSSGIVSRADFNFSSVQPTTGTFRRSTSTPKYKPAPVTGSITSNGSSTTTTMILDE